MKAEKQGLMNDSVPCGSKTYPHPVLLLSRWLPDHGFSCVYLSYESQDQLYKPQVNLSSVDCLPSFTEVTFGWYVIIFIMCSGTSLSGLEDWVVSSMHGIFWLFISYHTILLFSPKPIHHYFWKKRILGNPIQFSKIFTLKWAWRIVNSEELGPLMFLKYIASHFGSLCVFCYCLIY